MTEIPAPPAALRVASLMLLMWVVAAAISGMAIMTAPAGLTQPTLVDWSLLALRLVAATYAAVFLRKQLEAAAWAALGCAVVALATWFTIGDAASALGALWHIVMAGVLITGWRHLRRQ